MQTSITRTKIQNHIPTRISISYKTTQFEAIVPDVNFADLNDKSGKRYFDNLTSRPTREHL